jgi:hypothetical protein
MGKVVCDMNPATMFAAAYITSLCNRVRIQWGHTLTRINADLLLETPQFRQREYGLYASDIRKDALITFLNMQGFAYAEGKYPPLGCYETRLHLGFVAWDHGVTSLCESSRLGLLYYAPYKYGSTRNIWDYKDVVHGEYQEDILRCPDAYQMSLPHHIDVIRECVLYPFTTRWAIDKDDSKKDPAFERRYQLYLEMHSPSA